MRLIGFQIGMAVGLLAASTALAADQSAVLTNPKPVDGWIVTVGGSLQLGPKFDGASTFGISGMPSLSWRRASEPADFSAPDDSFDFSLYSTKTFSIGPVANFRAGRYGWAEPKLTGLKNIPWTIEPGVYAEYWLVEDRLRTRIEVRHGINGHIGFVSDLSADYVHKFDRFTLSFGPRLGLGDGGYMRKNFGISPTEAAANGKVSAFRPTGGVRSAGAAVALSYLWSPNWTTQTFAKYDRLTGEAGKSPIARVIGQHDQFTFGVGATYSFQIQ